MATLTDLQSAATDPLAAWHTMPAEEVLKNFEVTGDGLSADEARRRMEQFGPNELPHQPPPSWLEIHVRQLYSPLIYVLIAAAVVAVMLGDIKDAIFIGIVVLLNVLIGGYQEWRAEQNTRALQQLLKIVAMVVRDGERSELDAEQLVPGDLVRLESGNRIPADMRLIDDTGLEVDESLLTGESHAVHKDTQLLVEPATPLADRRNMVFAGSIVVRGRGEGVVVATGKHTSVGQLAQDLMVSTGGKPPLIVRMEQLSTVLAVGAVVASALVAIIGIFVQGLALTDAFFFAVALTVSVVPEGLPVALTIALAVATSRMAARGVIVRRLAAVEGLGSCTLIASDKTGTLTCNALTVQQMRLPGGQQITVTGEGFEPIGEVLFDGKPVAHNQLPESLKKLARVALLCNEADLHQRNDQWYWSGDAVDVALLSLAKKCGVHAGPLASQYPLLAAIPFEPERQYSASFHQMEGETLFLVKGGPERVLAMCNADNAATLDQWRNLAEEMGRQGFRVLALAERVASDVSPHDLPPQEISGLTCLGLVGMIDPLRPGVQQAIVDCHDAGITVAMVTGDHPVTALAISRELGLATNNAQVVTGAQLADESESGLIEVVNRARVFARVAPRQKLEIVQAAQRGGQYVAVTGDGVNDAPALRQANIGVAMGKSGTDVAREAAELVISDDNFATIVAGVEEGRIAYDNIRKVTLLLVSTGAAEVVMVILAVALGYPLPLTAVQLLWLNLVTNGIQHIGLSFEPGEGDVLKRKPRSPNEPIFNRLMIERTLVSAFAMGGVSFLSFAWMITENWEVNDARNILLLLMVLFENVHVGNCRSESKSLFRINPISNPLVLAGVLAALLIHVVAMYTPFGAKVLGAYPVDWQTWLTLLALACTVNVAVELHKLYWHWRTK